MLEDDSCCRKYFEALQEYTMNVNTARVPYNPLARNSNSAAHEAVVAMGFRRPWPPLGILAPGWERRLLR